MAMYFQEADPVRILADYPIGDPFMRGTARLLEVLRDLFCPPQTSPAEQPDQGAARQSG